MRQTAPIEAPHPDKSSAARGGCAASSRVPDRVPGRAAASGLRRRVGAIASLIAVALGGLGAEAATAAPRLAPLDVVVIIDDSGSEFGPHGTDPTGLRYTAARFAARFLGSIASAGLDHRVGIVRFGSQAPTVDSVPLQPVPTDVGAIDAELTTPTNLGATNFAAALTAAGRILGPRAPGRRPVIVIFTDGTPDLGNHASETALFAQIAAAKARLPGVQINLLGVDHTGGFARVAPRWRALGARVESLPDVSPDQLSQAFVTLLSSDLGLTTGALKLSPSAPSATVVVAPYQEALAVTHFGPDPGTRVQVTAPDGKVAGTTRPGRAGLLTIPRPAAGSWTVRLAAGAAATVAVDPVPLQATLVDPPGPTIPIGTGLRVTGSFLTSDGRTLPPLPRYPTYFGATVTAPDGSVTPLQLEALRPGLYEAAQAVPVTQPGPYAIAFSVKGAELSALRGDIRSVTAAIVPYFSATTTNVHSRGPFTVRARLSLDGQAISPRNAVTDDPNEIGVSRLYGPGGQLLETERLTWLGGPDYGVRFRHGLGDGARAALTMSLTATMRSTGAAVHDVVPADLVAEPTSGQTFRDWLGRLLLVLAGVAATLGLVLGAWWWTRPRVSGRFQIEGFAREVHGRHLIVGTGFPLRPVIFVWGCQAGRVKLHRGRLPLPFGATEVASTRVRPVVGSTRRQAAENERTRRRS